MNYTKQNAAGEKHLLRILFSAVSGSDPLSGRAVCSDMKLFRLPAVTFYAAAGIKKPYRHILTRLFMNPTETGGSDKSKRKKK